MSLKIGKSFKGTGLKAECLIWIDLKVHVVDVGYKVNYIEYKQPEVGMLTDKVESNLIESIKSVLYVFCLN